MFLFIKQWFRRSGDSKKEEEEAVEEKRPKGTPLYSMEFEGAKKIMISRVDCGKKNVAAVSRAIVRPERVKAVADLLDELPREGGWRKDIDPCTEYTLTAHDAENEPFAHVTFYAGDLKLENGAFIANGERALQQQEELFAIVTETLK